MASHPRCSTTTPPASGSWPPEMMMRVVPHVVCLMMDAWTHSIWSSVARDLRMWHEVDHII
jgi:hypothetical protein